MSESQIAFNTQNDLQHIQKNAHTQTCAQMFAGCDHKP